MNFKEYIALHKQTIYNLITSYVQIKDPEGHYAIMRDYIDRQGNYRRPGLVLLTGQLFEARLPNLLLPAAAEQLSEEWILMQDDIEDDSEMRRGKPAAHRIYGWIHTLNATNTGHMAMWKMLKDYLVREGPELGGQMYDKFYDMLQYTVEGQYIENMFIHNTKDVKSGSEELYYRIVDSKTCYYTVFGPMQLGAIAARQPSEVLEMLQDIGTAAGKAFQITDDILDMTADEKIFGKKNFGDLYEGKLTLMILKAYKDATPAEKDKVDRIYKKSRREKTPEEIQFLVDMIKKYGGIEYATEAAKRYGSQAEELLEQYDDRLPNNEYKDIMVSAINELYTRKQ